MNTHAKPNEAGPSRPGPPAAEHMSAQLLAMQEKERQRIAADLHDGLGQSLSLLKLMLDDTLLLLEQGDTPAAVDMLRRLLPRTKDLIGEVRRIAMDLHPSMLDDLGLLPTLSWFLREFASACRTIRVDKQISLSEADIPLALRVTIFRIVQEALGNIVRHSGCRQVWLALTLEQGRICLSIVDDGCGFCPTSLLSDGGQRGGMGLRGMRERVQASDGEFLLESAPGRGCRIRACWSATGGEYRLF